MPISYAIHLQSGVHCDIKFEVDTVTAADVHNLIITTKGEIGPHLYVNPDFIAGIEIMNDNKN